MANQKLDTKQTIKQAIEQFSKPTQSLTKSSLDLFQALGYNTDRQSPLNAPTYQEFQNAYIHSNLNSGKFSEERAQVKDWQYIDLLFQITSDELKDQLPGFSTQKVDDTIIESYLFFALELSQDTYSRSTLSQITREINKLFPMPVMVLFKYDSNLSLAIIDRRLHKKDEQKDVLIKVTLIKDISIQSSHRAHIEILFDLSLDELCRKYKFTNFVELHQAWQKALDTKELNKKFYKELSNWYFWAMDQATFPDDIEKNKEIRNATSLIRLITRIIFIWFIKEKGLIPEKLFNPNELKTILKAFSTNAKTSSFYQAILQNLFFGTLNQKMNDRKFAQNGCQTINKAEYGVKILFRYDEQFTIPKEQVIELFQDIPFLNGGLFDCLDKENEFGKVLYADGFSRNPAKQAFVPDFLFFGKELEVDLNKTYDTKNKEYSTKGLINILDSYKFTITENTPIEEEIALDPELLGKVFENLLASYNPETQTTARKSTGSFYTPREIVNYMVDESLIAYFNQKLEDAGKKDTEEKLRQLIGYNENNNLLSREETRTLIGAIDSCKILDPACGSGAFPMGILQKLVHVLHKIDPQNEQWKERQIQKARGIDDSAIREQLIADIESAFVNNELDYGRKLYLIENCIYGVDIQPIAIQIAKLRFFISLIIDQKKDPKKENFGIRSLPNLETKFVCANTLIGLERPEGFFRDPFLVKKEEDLKDLRHDYFSSKTREQKLGFQKKDQALRKEISELLIKDGWGDKSAKQLSEWNPYDQNASSPFFDPEWMFGLTDGFDIVIGNPPYIKEYTDRNVFNGIRNSEYYQGKMDLWYLFGCKAIDLLKENGITTFIATNNWITNEGASKFRNKVLSDTAIRLFVDFRDFMIFENVSIQTMVFLLEKIKEKKYKVDYRKVATEKCTREDAYELLIKSGNHDFYNFTICPENLIDKRITFYKDDIHFILDKIHVKKNFILDENSEVAQGIVAPQDYLNPKSAEKLKNKIPVGSGIFYLTSAEKEKLNLTQKEENLIKPLYTTDQLSRYYGNQKNTNWVIYTDSKFKKKQSIMHYPNIKQHLDKFLEIITSDNKPYGLHRSRDENFFQGEKIISLRKCFNRPIFTYTNFDCYVSQTFFIIKTDRINLKYLTAILNSDIIAFWLKNKGKMQGTTFQIDKGPILEIPVFLTENVNQNIIAKVVDFIIVATKENKKEIELFFDNIIQVAVYELYFTEEIKTAKAELLKHLTNLPELKEFWDDEQKLNTIRNVYNELSNPNHPVFNAMEKMKSIPEIRIIEGLDK